MVSNKRTVAAFVIGLMIVAGAAWAAKKVYNFKGGVTTRADKGITKQDLKPQTSDSGFFSWTYTFMFYLDDDSSGMIQFTYWKMYIKQERGLYFAFSDKGDKLTFRKGIYGAEQVTYAADPPDFKMGPHFWKGFHPDYHVHMDFAASEGEPEMKADIHFKCRTPGWRPGEGPVHYVEPDGDWYDLVVMIPWADITGTVTINGKTRQLKGWGYSDHNTQTVFPTTQSDKLMALRSFNDGYSVNFLEYIAPKDFDGERTTWILVMKGNRIVYATDKWDREMSDHKTEPRRGYKYPTKMKFKIDQPGCKLDAELTGTKYIGALDAMDNLPPFIRRIAERFLSAPVMIRQNAVIDYHLVVPDQGIDDNFTAKGVYETTIVQ